MNPYVDEEAAWQRLVDLQREIEYSRLIAHSGLPGFGRLAGGFVRRASWLARLAMRRTPRPRPAAAEAVRSEPEATSDAA